MSSVQLLMRTNRTGPTPTHYSLTVADDDHEIRAAQRLRHRVFAGEMGAVLDCPEPGRDADRFDAHCDHLVVREDGTGEVVGTYRMLRPAGAARAGGLYCETAAGAAVGVFPEAATRCGADRCGAAGTRAIPARDVPGGGRRGRRGATGCGGLPPGGGQHHGGRVRRRRDAVGVTVTRWLPPARAQIADLRAVFEEVTTTRTVWRNLPPAVAYLARRPRRPAPSATTGAGGP